MFPLLYAHGEMHPEKVDWAWRPELSEMVVRLVRSDEQRRYQQIYLNSQSKPLLKASLILFPQVIPGLLAVTTSVKRRLQARFQSTRRLQLPSLFLMTPPPLTSTLSPFPTLFAA